MLLRHYGSYVERYTLPASSDSWLQRKFCAKCTSSVVFYNCQRNIAPEYVPAKKSRIPFVLLSCVMSSNMAINLQHSARLLFFPCKILDLLGADQSNHGGIKSSHMPTNKVEMERKRGRKCGNHKSWCRLVQLNSNMKVAGFMKPGKYNVT